MIACSQSCRKIKIKIKIFLHDCVFAELEGVTEPDGRHEEPRRRDAAEPAEPHHERAQQETASRPQVSVRCHLERVSMMSAESWCKGLGFRV